ncbi:hypothetical protein BGW41_006804, partial [Actinomortierella wolfii]
NNKNKSTSAASSPAQTPRSSMQASRSADSKMTKEQALELIHKNAFAGGVQTLPLM